MSEHSAIAERGRIIGRAPQSHKLSFCIRCHLGAAIAEPILTTSSVTVCAWLVRRQYLAEGEVDSFADR